MEGKNRKLKRKWKTGLVEENQYEEKDEPVIAPKEAQSAAAD